MQIVGILCVTFFFLFLSEPSWAMAGAPKRAVDIDAPLKCSVLQEQREIATFSLASQALGSAVSAEYSYPYLVIGTRCFSRSREYRVLLDSVSGNSDGKLRLRIQEGRSDFGKGRWENMPPASIEQSVFSLRALRQGKTWVTRSAFSWVRVVDWVEPRPELAVLCLLGSDNDLQVEVQSWLGLQKKKTGLTLEEQNEHNRAACEEVWDSE